MAAFVLFVRVVLRRLARTAILGLLAAPLLAPIPAAATPSADMVTVGFDHSCALLSGVAKCWGHNNHGQLGDGTTTDRSSMVDVQTSVDFTKIVAGGDNTCALGTDGKAYCWGFNNEGQAGDGTTTDRLAPVAVAGLTSLVDLAVEGVAACARTITTIYCWGRGIEGDLGDGNGTNSLTPVQVDTAGVLNGLTIQQMTAGDGHVCVLASDGNPYCWGYNGSGGLGDGLTTFTNALAPVAVDVSGLTAGQTTQISAEAWTTCITNAGAAYCFGLNDARQVGDATTTNRDAPTAVAGLSGTVTAAYGGQTLGCALIAGAASCWGNNAYGQLGDGTTTGGASPVAVDTSDELNGVTLRTVAPGGQHACAISTADRVYCWGRNNFGQVGNRSTIDQPSPVPAQLFPAAPSAPQSVHSTVGDGSVTVSWSAPASSGGAAITGYTATVGGGHSCSTTGALHCTIGGLTNGTAYTATVTAQNGDGTSVVGTAAAAATPTVAAGLPVTGSAVATVFGVGLLLVVAGFALLRARFYA
jgi:alpha-tubulin suppressor-like RCC1 family protein